MGEGRGGDVKINKTGMRGGRKKFFFVCVLFYFSSVVVIIIITIVYPGRVALLVSKPEIFKACVNMVRGERKRGEKKARMT